MHMSLLELSLCITMDDNKVAVNSSSMRENHHFTFVKTIHCQPEEFHMICISNPNKIPHRWMIVVIVIDIARFGAMFGKVVIAQTLARRTWQDFNMLALAHGMMTFLNIMTRKVQQQRCGAILLELRSDFNLTLFECNHFCH